MGYSRGITLKKMIYQGLLAGGSAFVTFCTGFLVALPPEQQAMEFGIILILLKGAENWLKHRNDF